MTNKNIKNPADRRQWLLVALCWAIYTASYLGKYCYNANKSIIMSYFAIDKATAGLVGTCFFIAYGAGQVVNGLLCKKYNMRFVVFGSLLISACCNAVMAFCNEFAVLKYVWFINGATLSVLWPTLVRLLSETLSDDYCPRAVVVMGTSVAVGTFITYGISAAFNAGVGADVSYKYAFLTAIICLPVLALVWNFAYPKLVGKGKENKEEKTLIDPQAMKAPTEKKKIAHPLMVSLVILAFFAVVTNLVKDGLTTWIPKILEDTYEMPSYLSILLTLFLPMLALFGTAVAVRLNKKFPDTVNLCALAFAFIGILMGAVMLFANLSAAVMILCLSLVSLSTSAINNAVTSMFPLYHKAELNSGMAAGVLNGFCYIGSALSDYGLGLIADLSDWNVVFIVLCVASEVCVLIAIIRAVVKKIRRT